MITVTYTTDAKEKIKGSFRKVPGGTDKPTIIYIHGGGLIFGNRDDLPIQYADLFVQAGYPILSLDYLLAPESDYQAIIGSVQAGLNYFLNHSDELELRNNDYILFGRSAGAYLCIQLMAENLQKSPVAFIDLYGFESLLAPNLKQFNNLYSKYPEITKDELQPLIRESPISNSSQNDRFLIYVYARQSSAWQKMIFQSTPTTEANLDKNLMVTNFPPTYMCHSNSDPDVPFINSIILKSKLPNARLIPIESKEHDFDRNVTSETLVIYKNIIQWLKNTRS
ncbi:MAG TPA: alpha/beta hydrolase [Lactobacillus sp.]|nr:alpha/beta hydrolase [Lactobacillus sp.]